MLGGVGSPQRVPLPVEDEVAVALHRQPVVAVRRRQPRPTLELGASDELCPVPGTAVQARWRPGAALVAASLGTERASTARASPATVSARYHARSSSIVWTTQISRLAWHAALHARSLKYPRVTPVDTALGVDVPDLYHSLRHPPAQTAHGTIPADQGPGEAQHGQQQAAEAHQANV